MGTIFFVSGLNTLIQTTFGDRLPIVQGGSFAFLGATYVMLSNTCACACTCPCAVAVCNSYLSAPCASPKHARCVCPGRFGTIGQIAADPKWCINAPSDEERQLSECSSEKERFLETICTVQGSIIVVGLVQIAMGYSGIMCILVKYISPVTIAPTVAMVGLGLSGMGVMGGMQNCGTSHSPATLLSTTSPVPFLTKCCARRVADLPRHRAHDGLFADVRQD